MLHLRLRNSAGLITLKSVTLNGNGGQYANCSSLPLQGLEKEGVKLAVMVNAGGKAYSMPDKSLIDAVRVACHPDETEIGIHNL